MTDEQIAFISCESTKHMEYTERLGGVRQMMVDLKQLAERDGCIAAAWAYDLLRELKFASDKVPYGSWQVGRRREEGYV